MNVLSLFDGMSCGQLALERAGIKVYKYYASELDKFAVKESTANWPNMIHLGDVTKWREWDIDWADIDLLIGGSPCQGFSFAGKQLAFDDPRSKLFFMYVDILNHIKSRNPDVKFMLENVRMKKEHLDVITEHLGVEPVFINSALVSAQNRRRYYWANWEFGQPSDKGILLEHIIEKAATNPTVLSDGTSARFKRYGVDLIDKPRNKARCLAAMKYVKNGKQGNYIQCDQDGEQTVFTQFVDREKSRAISCTECTGNNPQQYYDKRKKNLVFALQMKPRGNNKGGLRALDGKTPSMTANSLQDNFNLTDGLHYRKLTVIECCRLQTVRDDYFKVSSNTQAYKMLGNGWTVDVIAHILSGIPQ